MPEVPPATPIFPKPPYRVGLVGVTGYGHAYFESLNALAEKRVVELTAVTIINPEQAVEQIEILKKAGVPIYGEYREMLESEKRNLDWVCLPTGIGCHTRMTLDCLKLGFQVLVEKPLAPTLQEVEAIQAAERNSGIEVGVGFQHTYLKDTWEIKERLLQGEIGELQRVDCIGIWPRSRSYYHRNEWSGHLHDGESWILDSPLHNGLSHLVNLILFWTGDRLETRARLANVSAELYRSKPIESFDTLRTVAQLESGVEAAVLLSHGSLHQIDPEIVITGTKGEFRWRFYGSHTFYVNGEKRTLKSPHQLKVRDLMFDAMVDHVGGGPSRICTTELAKGTCKWVNAVHDTIPIHDIPDSFRESVVAENGETFDIIEGLEYYALRAYKEKRSFAELGAPWAVQPRIRELEGYVAFEGKYCPDFSSSPAVGKAASQANS